MHYNTTTQTCVAIMVPQERLELSILSALVSKTSVYTIPPSGHKFALLLNLVLPRGIEPLSMVLQTTAMTTSAKVAWCSHRELNSEFILTKDVLYHLTMRAIEFVSSSTTLLLPFTRLH